MNELTEQEYYEGVEVALLDFVGTNKYFKNNHLVSFFRTH
jgi:hypothetical protein